MKKPASSPISRAADRLAKREVDYGFDDRLLPLDAVMQIAGLSRAMIYRKIRQGSFPRQYKPGGAASRWSEREVMAWRDAVMARRAG